MRMYTESWLSDFFGLERLKPMKYEFHTPSTPKQEPATINPCVDQYWSPETIATKAFARRVKLAARHGVKLVKDAYGDIWAMRIGCPSVRVGE